MANIIIPFDNNPVTISLSKTSYTVPAGKYARMRYRGSVYSKADSTGQSNTTRTLTIADIPNIDGLIPLKTSFGISHSYTGTSANTAYNAYWNLPVHVWPEFRSITMSAGAGQSTHTSYMQNSTITTLGISAGAAGSASDQNASPVNQLRHYKSTGNGGGGTVTAYWFVKSKEDDETYWLPSGTIINVPTGCTIDIILETYNVIS